ncbi:MAG: hypothetical protein IE922_01605 [Sphingomonadales bacterium]|nr:hypothetical protein [Sphingomonadales bacterium]
MSRRVTKSQADVPSLEDCAAAGMTVREAAIARGASLSSGMDYASRHGLRFAPALEHGHALTATRHPNLSGPELSPQRPGRRRSPAPAEIDWFAPLTSRVISERRSGAV